jgi:hypothetical protein
MYVLSMHACRGNMYAVILLNDTEKHKNEYYKSFFRSW